MKRYSSLWIVIFLTGIITSCSYTFYPTECKHQGPGNLTPYTTLDTTLSETSGLIYLDGRFWSINDSGGEAALYCFDHETGLVERKITISDASNVDWEGMAMDSQYLYVADVGNNFGTRDTLQIYRVLKSKMESNASIISHDGIISITYDAHDTVNAYGFSSLDCEALFTYQDSLYLFSKDWVHETISVYVIPSEPGHHIIQPRYHYDAHILVTGADHFPHKKEVALVGYRNYFPIVITYGYDNEPGAIKCGGRARIFVLRRGRQVEGICYDSDGNLFVSSEKSLRQQTFFKLGRIISNQ